jgi:hypothetical protein
VLTQETGAQWAIVVEGELRTPVLLIPGAKAMVVPLVSFTQLQSAKDITDLRQMFERMALRARQGIT